MPNMTVVDESSSANSPTPAVVLGWIAAAGSRAWFPAEFAQQSNIPREALDQPIHALRHAGLIRVHDWVKGLGQGYAVTPDGLNYVHEPQKLTKLLAEPPKPEPVADEPPTTFDRGEEARQALLWPRPPLVVQVLITLNVLWFLVGLVLAIQEGRSGNAYLSNGDPGLTERLGGIWAVGLIRGEWWRLVSSAFVHIGALHLFMNMYALASIGSLTESIWGRRRFLLLYLACAIGGSCLATVVQSLQPLTVTAGASGAIWGLMTSLATWLVLHRQHLPPPMANQSLQRLGILLAINVMVSFIPGVSWAGHFGGGIVGFVVACLFVIAQRFGRMARWVALAATVLLVAACVATVVAHTYRSEQWVKLRRMVAIQRYFEYVKAVDPLLQPIGQPLVETLYRQVMEAVRLDPTKRPELPEQVAKLRADADALLAYVAKNPPPDLQGADEGERYRTYALAVKELAEAMQDTLQRPDAGLGKVKELKKAVDQKLLALMPNLGL